VKRIAALILIIFCTLKSFAQDPRTAIDSSKLEYLPIDSITKIVSFEDVIKVDSASKDELFKRAQAFFKALPQLKLGNYELVVADEATGRVAGVGKFAASTGKGITLVPFNVIFTITIIVKEGRYRYELTDFKTDNDVDITKWYTDPKNRRSSGEMKPSSKGYVTNTSVMGQAIAYLLKLRMSRPIIEQKDPRDNF